MFATSRSSITFEVLLLELFFRKSNCFSRSTKKRSSQKGFRKPSPSSLTFAQPSFTTVSSLPASVPTRCKEPLDGEFRAFVWRCMRFGLPRCLEFCRRFGIAPRLPIRHSCDTNSRDPDEAGSSLGGVSHPLQLWRLAVFCGNLQHVKSHCCS